MKRKQKNGAHSKEKQSLCGEECPLRQAAMRSFSLVRAEDVSGSSGTGTVAHGIELHDGQVLLKWNRPPYSTAIYRDLHSMLLVHDHGGRTEVLFHQQDARIVIAKPSRERRRATASH